MQTIYFFIIVVKLVAIFHLMNFEHPTPSPKKSPHAVTIRNRYSPFFLEASPCSTVCSAKASGDLTTFSMFQ